MSFEVTSLFERYFTLQALERFLYLFERYLASLPFALFRFAVQRSASWSNAPLPGAKLRFPEQRSASRSNALQSKS
jgi:hypothetical protein